MTYHAVTLLDAGPYRQLRPPEKAFVDAFVRELEREAQFTGQRITFALHRPITADQVAASNGLLERPLVQAAITERIHQIARDTELSVDRVLRSVANLAFSSIDNYFDRGEDGNLYANFSKTTPEQMEAIASVTVEETYTKAGKKVVTKVTTHDKTANLARLLKYMGADAEDHAHWRLSNTIPQQATLPADVTADKAADMWASFISE